MTIYPNPSTRSYELHSGIWKTTQNTTWEHISTYVQLIGTIFREYYSSYFLVAYVLAVWCFNSWVSGLITAYSIVLLVCRHSGPLLIYSLSWWRDWRVSTGWVGTPSDKIAVGRFSEVSWASFQGQRVFALCSHELNCKKILLNQRSRSSMNISLKWGLSPTGWRIIKQWRTDLNNITSEQVIF